MQSLRSKLVIGLIKKRHLFKLKLKPEVVDDNFSVDAFRRSVDKATARIKLPKNITIKKLRINGLDLISS
jgi:hypothetical protein